MWGCQLLLCSSINDRSNMKSSVNRYVAIKYVSLLVVNKGSSLSGIK